MTGLVINVVGTPAPQGSKKGFYNHATGRVQMKESSAKVKPWRQDVAAAAGSLLEDIQAGIIQGPELPFTGPLQVDITFYLARPGYHFGTGKNAQRLKPNAPTYVDKKPDKDKLERSTCDALTTSGVIRDDAQIAAGFVEKRYADGPTGARITIRPLDSVLPTSQGEGSEGSTDTHHTQQGVLL